MNCRSVVVGVWLHFVCGSIQPYPAPCPLPPAPGLRYILVECKDPNKAVRSMYSRVWNEFVRTLETGNSEQQALKHMLKRQRDFLAGLRNVSEEVKSFAGILDFGLILTPFSRPFMHSL